MSGLSTNPGGPILGRWEKPFELLLGGASALILAAIMLLTCVDVAGRYVFSMPVPGALEVSELMMGALIFTSLPLVTLRQQQVMIDLFEPFIPKFVKPALHVVIQLVGDQGGADVAAGRHHRGIAHPGLAPRIFDEHAGSRHIDHSPAADPAQGSRRRRR